MAPNKINTAATAAPVVEAPVVEAPVVEAPDAPDGIVNKACKARLLKELDVQQNKLAIAMSDKDDIIISALKANQDEIRETGNKLIDAMQSGVMSYSEMRSRYG